MDELMHAAWPWLPGTLGAVILLLAAPLVHKAGRVTIAAVLDLTAGVAVIFAIVAGSEPRTLAIRNPFPTGEDGSLEALTFQTVEAPGWQWHVAAAVLLTIAALAVWLVRSRPGRPGAVLVPFLVGAWIVAARLVFEWTAAPAGLVWATGLSLAMFPIALFQGIYVRRAGRGFGALAAALLVVAILHRALVSGLAWVLTTQQLGSHLDFNPLEGFQSALIGERTFGDDPHQKWLHAALIPQMLMWVPGQFVIGLVLGGLGFAVTRRPKAS